MDIGLGKKFSNVDFDYAAFGKEADRQGISPEKQANLQVILEKPALLRSGYLHSSERGALCAS